MPMLPTQRFQTKTEMLKNKNEFEMKFGFRAYDKWNIYMSIDRSKHYLPLMTNFTFEFGLRINVEDKHMA